MGSIQQEQESLFQLLQPFSDSWPINLQVGDAQGCAREYDLCDRVGIALGSHWDRIEIAFGSSQFGTPKPCPALLVGRCSCDCFYRLALSDLSSDLFIFQGALMWRKTSVCMPWSRQSLKTAFLECSTWGCPLSEQLKEVAIMARSPKNDAKVAKPPNNPNQIAFALINCSLVQLTSSSRSSFSI